jgi:hypothetical protein
MNLKVQLSKGISFERNRLFSGVGSLFSLADIIPRNQQLN